LRPRASSRLANRARRWQRAFGIDVEKNATPIPGVDPEKGTSGPSSTSRTSCAQRASTLMLSQWHVSDKWASADSDGVGKLFSIDEANAKL
jgi:hypothetical protein